MRVTIKNDYSCFSNKKLSSIKKYTLLKGVTGQDGAYLSEILVAKGYKVHGIKHGTPRKLVDVSKLKAAGWQAKIGLEEGITAGICRPK